MTGKLKWILLALSVSLMVNVFAAGHFLGERRPPPPGPGQNPGEGWAGRLLPQDLRGQIPKEARQAFRKEMMSRRGDVRDARAALKDARQRVMEELRRDTLDQVAVETALADVRRATDSLQGSFEQSLVAALATMTPEQRMAVAKRMVKRGKRAEGFRKRANGERMLPAGPPLPPPPGEQPPEF